MELASKYFFWNQITKKYIRAMRRQGATSGAAPAIHVVGAGQGRSGGCAMLRKQ
ncbi:hypothetical protein [Comamonas terrae]|uniref:Uncharacterized protein n=1 Tax=Comamonas terrae TaxID=673548 RepID=A0ABW5UTV7_9BURK|nr:hypothetical protein [Comamonas terrae]